MITEAAIVRNGVIYTGRRHHEIINNQTSGFFRGCAQGFVTDAGTFVDRREAAVIALECGQIKTAKDALFSEDLG